MSLNNLFETYSNRVFRHMIEIRAAMALAHNLNTTPGSTSWISLEHKSGRAFWRMAANDYDSKLDSRLINNDI